MKKLQLVELGIVAVILIIGYEMITTLIGLITNLLFYGGIDQSFVNIILPSALFFAFYLITFFVLARNVKSLARFFCRKNEDLLEFKLNKTAVLHIIIIAICLNSFLKTIPTVFEYLINRFIIYPEETYDNLEASRWNRNQDTFWNSMIGLTIAIIFLLASKKIASFLGKEDRTFEIAGDKIESNI